MTATTECTSPIDMSASAGQPAGPCVLVIFGASGDLAKRKLIPALANLAGDKLLPDNFAIVGVATRPWGHEDLRESAREGLEAFAGDRGTAEVSSWLTERMYYLSGDFRERGTYERLKKLLEDVDAKHSTAGNYLYYLATAPTFFADVPQFLAQVGLSRNANDRWRRLIVEKPFGTDLASAQELNRKLWRVFDEQQLFRIDHYLGKETVQNILAFRFANGIFEPIWNRRYIDHVQITAAEAVGVEQRGRYYDHAGALRDMIPNHLFQLVTLTAMEPPVSFEADAVRDEQVKILKAIPPLSADDVRHNVVRGQYGPSGSVNDRLVAYRSEDRVDAESTTPTYVAMKFLIDSWRWAGVPFYLRTGKRLKRRITEIGIRFKRPPFTLFRNTPVDHLNPNWLVLRLQPEEGISLSFGAKVPGVVMRLGNVDMEFCYRDYFGGKPQTGYERLLYDGMLGDATLFQRSDMVETSWQVVAPILEAWESEKPGDFPNYAAGSWGPATADELLARDARAWRNCE